MAPRNREFGSMLWFSRSLSRFETQDIKTQPQINHNMNSLTFSSSSFSIYRSIIFHLPIIYLFHLLRDKFWRILILLPNAMSHQENSRSVKAYGSFFGIFIFPSSKDMTVKRCWRFQIVFEVQRYISIESFSLPLVL